MTKQEIKIVTKIMRELTLFLMMHGYHNFDVKVLREESFVQLVYRLDSLSEQMKDTIKEKINRAREMEIETYGWELVGDLDAKSELEIVGLLIDEVNVRDTAEGVVLTFTRKQGKK